MKNAPHKTSKTAHESKPTKDDGERETVTQHKPTLNEALTGDVRSMDAIGEGSVTEEAPAVRGATAGDEVGERIVQQGDDVLVHTRNPINTNLVNKAKVHSINDDGTINVRVPMNNGAPPQDISSVTNRDMGDGSPHWEFDPNPGD